MVRRSFDDLLVPAGRTLPPELTGRLERRDLKKAVAYQPKYLSGFRAESYTVELEEGFGEARNRMNAVIRGDVRKDIGGHQQRLHHVHTRFDGVTSKYLLLPTVSRLVRLTAWRPAIPRCGS